jgi:hypothetical protein
MRKHPLIALTAFTALGASAIAGASTGGFATHSVLTSARGQASLASAKTATEESVALSERTSVPAYFAPLGRRDDRAMHDLGRPAGLHLNNITGRIVVLARKHQPSKVKAALKAPVTMETQAPPVTAPPPVPTTVPPTTQPAPPPTTAPPAPPPPSGGVWYELRMCESGDNYAEDTGNGYYGAYQFALSTWYGLGFSGLPSDASPALQDEAAQELQAEAGWGQWPSCAAQLGL